MRKRSIHSLHRLERLAAVAAVAALALNPAVTEAQGQRLGSNQAKEADRRLEATPGTCGTTASATPLAMMSRPAKTLGGGDPGRQLPPGDRSPFRSLHFGVLLQEGARDFVVARRLTRAAFEQRHNQLAGQGCYLEDFEIVEEGSEPRFSGLWHPGSVAQRLELGISQRLFMDGHVGAVAAGLLPADVETYMHQGERLFAGVWRDNATGNRLIIDVEKAQIPGGQAAGLDGTVQGVRRMVDLESWTTAGGRRYMAVHKPSSVPARVFFGHTFAELGAKLQPLFDQGYQPVELEIEDENGAPRYSMVWNQAPGSSWVFVGSDQSLQDCRLVSLRLESSEFQPSNAEACRSLSGLQHRGALDQLARPKKRATGGRTVTPLPGPDLDLEPVPPGTPPLHIFDFEVTRRKLGDSSSAKGVEHHRSGFHDSGPSGPG